MYCTPAMRKAFIFSMVLFCGCSVLAQGLNENDFDRIEPVGEKKADRKYPSILKRPDKDTPAEQLEWAKELLEKGEKRQARKQFRNLVHEWHGSREAPEAQLNYARLLDEAGKYVVAFREYQYLMDNFSGSFPHEEVLDRQFRIANHVKNERRFRFIFFPGFSAPERALPMYESIIKNGRNWEKAPEAQFQIGLIHEDDREYEEAVIAFEYVRMRYSKSPYALQAAFRRAVCLYRMARIYRYDERSIREALSALAMFRRDHPKSAEAAEAGRMLQELKDDLAEKYYRIAVYYDNKVKKPEAALIAYTNYIRQFPSSDMVKTAEARIEALRVQLELEENEE